MNEKTFESKACLVVILRQEVSANDDENESDGSGELIEEAFTKGGPNKEVCEEQSRADDDGADGPEST